MRAAKDSNLAYLPDSNRLNTEVIADTCHRLFPSYHPAIRGASWERSIQLSYAIRSLENHHLAAGFELATSPSDINIVYNRTKRKAIRDQGDEPVEGLGRFGSDA